MSLNILVIDTGFGVADDESRRIRGKPVRTVIKNELMSNVVYDRPEA